MNRIFILLVLCCSGLMLGMVPARHEFYVTVTELNKVSDTLQVSIRIFTDDLEHILEEETGKPVFLQPGETHDQVFRTIVGYVEGHFRINTAGKPCRLRWLGHEYVDDVTWLYAETVLDPDAGMLSVENTLLMHHFPEQQNLVHFKTATGYESGLCTKDQPEARFVINP